MELGDEAEADAAEAEATQATRRGLELPAGAILPRERRERKEEVGELGRPWWKTLGTPFNFWG